MPSVLSDLLASKKFVAALALSALLIAASHFGYLSKEDATSFLKVLWPVYLGAQGVADVGDKLAQGHVAVNEDKTNAYGRMAEEFSKAVVAGLSKSSPEAGASETKTPS